MCDVTIIIAQNFATHTRFASGWSYRTLALVSGAEAILGQITMWLFSNV
jgi:hypothetical protein